ncbi:MAG: sigma-70 family RNA polymerase sigma factor [Phycisphaeraceae bacterium]|nr:MAG: sigma-70 family RNA polymerase sigma factor [Phycisphaeraceae bacterium]
MDPASTRMKFPTTNILRVESARAGGDGLNDFLSLYWRAIYAYIRRSGHDRAAAADLAQGFVLSRIVEGDLLKTFDPDKGSLRSYIKQSLVWYLRNEHRHATAKRRHPERMTGTDLDELPVEEPDSGDSPEAAFDRRYEADRLDRALGKVRGYCLERGMGVHWAMFEAWVLKRAMGNGEFADLTELAAQHGVENAEKASAMIRTVRRRVMAAMGE